MNVVSEQVMLVITPTSAKRPEKNIYVMCWASEKGEWSVVSSASIAHCAVAGFVTGNYEYSKRTGDVGDNTNIGEKRTGDVGDNTNIGEHRRTSAKLLRLS